MENYDKKLRKIMVRHDLAFVISKHYTPYTIMRLKLKRYIKNGFIAEIGEDDLVVCDDVSYNELKKCINTKYLIKYKGSTDGKVYQENCDTIISQITETNRKANNVYFVLSHLETVRLLNALYGMKKSFHIVSLYDLLESKGINLCFSDVLFQKGNPKKLLHMVFNYYECFFPFLSKMKYGGHACWLEEVLLMLQAYRESERLKKDCIPKEFLIKRVCAALCEIRDFNLLFQMEDKYNIYIWGKSLKCDIERLLEKIKKSLDKKSKDSVVVNWIDNVGCVNLDTMPFLKGLKETSLYFENNFSMLPWTKWAFRCMFSGRDVIGDKLFLLNDPIKEEKGKYLVYDEIKEQGYQLAYFGTKLRGCLNKPMDKLRPLHSRYYKQYNFSSQEQWRAITHLANSEDKEFILIHTLGETHPPFVSPVLDGIWNTRKGFCSEEQKEQSRVYLDEELAWYGKFYAGFTRAYLSDHGDANNPNSQCTYADDRIHKFFMINIPGLQGTVRKELLSAKNELRVLLRVINNEDYSDLLGDVITIESYDIYSNGLAKSVIGKLKEMDKGECMQHIAVRTYTEKYVLYIDGDERYFLLPDERTSHHNEPEYRDRIKVLRDMVIDKYIDPYKYDFFKESRLLYRAYGLKSSHAIFHERKSRLQKI